MINSVTLPINEEELEWVKMAIEKTLFTYQEALDWYNSQGQWEQADKARELVKRHTDILEKLNSV